MVTLYSKHIFMFEIFYWSIYEMGIDFDSVAKSGTLLLKEHSIPHSLEIQRCRCESTCVLDRVSMR